MKKSFAAFLCAIMLLCFAACDKNTNSNTKVAVSTNQGDTGNQTTAIFNTKNVKCVVCNFS